MADRLSHHLDLPTPKRDGLTIACELRNDRSVIQRVYDLASERDWQLLNLRKVFAGVLPQDVHVDGALIDFFPSDVYCQGLLQAGVPIVRVGYETHSQDHLVPVVLTDWHAAGRMAAEHFAQRGFKHFTFLANQPWCARRPLYEGLVERGEELGCVCHLGRYSAETKKKADKDPLAAWEQRHAQFLNWIAALPSPCGLLCATDGHAVRYCRWLVQAGWRVPDDVAILGVGNDPFVCEIGPVPISSLMPDENRIAETAVDLLQKMLDGQRDPPSVIKLPPRGIVTRHSTDVLAASDPRVAQAIKFIWAHIAEDLSVEEIARSAGVSRRTLERLFECSLGRGIYSELQRRRLEKSRELLLVTDLSVTQTAKAVGFGSPNYFCQAFSSAYGLSPSQYRRKNASAV